jgi:hypothetical protein
VHGLCCSAGLSSCDRGKIAVFLGPCLWSALMFTIEKLHLQSHATCISLRTVSSSPFLGECHGCTAKTQFVILITWILHEWIRFASSRGLIFILTSTAP